MKMAECHSEKPMRARGLCNACLQKVYKEEHPEAHKAAQKKAHQKRREHYPTEGREKKLKARYGVTLLEWEALLIEQNGCAICHTHEGVMHVDHDHESYQIRGILCENCNRGLGMFKDSLVLLDQAKEYISRVRQTRCVPELSDVRRR